MKPMSRSMLCASCVMAAAMLAEGTTAIHAQRNLQQVIAQKNAEAAAATWGYLDGVPNNFAPRPDPEGSAPTPQPFDPTAKSGSNGAGSLGGGGGQPDSKTSNSHAVDAAGAGGASAHAHEGHSDGVAGIASFPPVPAVPAIAADDVLSKLPPQRAQVTYSHGLLEISSNNASLNQILWAVESRTGMTITGGVTDQRVFGHYGPAAPADILVSLLEGTGTDIVLLQGSSRMELTLTARGGGPTARSPNASDDMPDIATGIADAPNDAQQVPSSAAPLEGQHPQN